MVFDFGGIAGGTGRDDFDMVSFFGEKPIVRINTLSSEDNILTRLKNVFGDQPIFTREIAAQMKKEMINDLKSNRKEEYMSPAGLAILFDQAGG